MVNALQVECSKALEAHLAGGAGAAGGAEAALHSGYELGRRALGDGLGILDMALLLYRTVMDQALRAGSPEEGARVLRAAENFLLECLSPFEMASRGARDANAALRHINELLEEETRRIAHELHDEAGQLLAGVYLAVDALAKDAPGEIGRRLAGIRGFLEQIETHLRRLAHELRPTILDDLGLLPALDFLAEGFMQRTGVKVALRGTCDGRLPSAIEVALYRLVQEALNNVARHARASLVTVTLKQQEGQVVCSVRDDGVGFDSEAVLRRGARGLGLLGMRERLAPFGGTLEIHSTPGRGTEVRVTAHLPGGRKDNGSPLPRGGVTARVSPPVETGDAAPGRRTRGVRRRG
jgi:signal transduction histidine kinase